MIYLFVLDRASRIPGRFAKDHVNTHANLPLVGNICTNGAVGTKKWGKLLNSWNWCMIAFYLSNNGMK